MFLIGAPVSKRLIEAAPNLKFIQKLGIGIDKIDCNACLSRGIAVARATGGNAIPVAEHTLLMMLAALRWLPYVDRNTRTAAGKRRKHVAFTELLPIHWTEFVTIYATV